MSMEDLRSVLAQPGLPVTKRPVFIVGSPRSGTTALARALHQHSELWASHESYFLHSLLGDGRAVGVYTRQMDRSAPGWLKTQQVERAEFLGFVGLGINAMYTSRSGGRRWVEQTPLYTLMVHDLAELFPDALFLHIVRDGRRVVHSMSNFLRKFEDRPEAVRHVPAWATDFRDACRTWNRWVATATDFCDASADRALTVRNEDLAADPAAGFARILSFLQVAAENGPADHFASKAVNSSFGETREGAATTQPWTQWSAEQRRTFTEEAGETMHRHGFAAVAELSRWAKDAPVPAATS